MYLIVLCSFIWQHVMKHVNLQPLDSHGVDFSRVRMWNLNNWARHYRQTLVFSSVQDPQLNSILTKHCANYRGQVRTPSRTPAGTPAVTSRSRVAALENEDWLVGFMCDCVSR